MGNMELLKREITKGVSQYKDELYPRALTFLKKEINIFIDQKIKETRNYNDNPVKPQRFNRKGENPYSST